MFEKRLSENVETKKKSLSAMTTSFVAQSLIKPPSRLMRISMKLSNVFCGLRYVFVCVFLPAVHSFSLVLPFLVIIISAQICIPIPKWFITDAVTYYIKI